MEDDGEGEKKEKLDQTLKTGLDFEDCDTKRNSFSGLFLQKRSEVSGGMLEAG